MDISPRAIEQARRKAAERGLAARFEVGDATDLGGLGLTAGTVLDCGLFHVFDDDNRARYVRSLAAVLPPGGTCYLMCFSDRMPGTFGPRRVTQDELRAGLPTAGRPSTSPGNFELNAGLPARTAQAWLATITRR